MKVMTIRTPGSPSRRMQKKISIREMEYLEFIKKKDIPLYHKVLAKLENNPLSPGAPNGRVRGPSATVSPF